MEYNCRRLAAAILNLAVVEYVTAVGYEANYENARDFLRSEWGTFLLEQMGRDGSEAYRHFRWLRTQYWHLFDERNGDGLLQFAQTYFPRRLNSMGMLASAFEITGNWRASYELQCRYGLTPETFDRICRAGAFPRAFQVEVARGFWWIVPLRQFDRWFLAFKRERWQARLRMFLDGKE